MTASALLAVMQRATERPLAISLLGPPQLVANGQSLALPRRQMRALLYRLAAELQPVPREHLCFLLWPDVADATARRHLTVLLNQLRQALPFPNAVLTLSDQIALDPAQFESDTVTFMQASALLAQRGEFEPLAEAVQRYAGPFLHGFSLPASAEFDAWVDQERQQWERRYLDALATLVNGYAASGAYSAAIAMAQRALAVDELAEEMHRWLITLYAAQGDRTAALRQFERCVVALERELGVSPLPETRAVYEAVRDGQVPLQGPLRVERTLPAVPSANKPAAAAATHRPALPAPSAPLIGRQNELEALQALLIDQQVRLLTLTGPGGSGKTRLALQAAWQAATNFADGAAFVALAPLRDPALVVQAIGQACGVGQPSLSALAEHLRDKRLLLVLDNCEHLLASGRTIAGLLAAAPGLQVLATSRAALNLHGEQIFPVTPLPLPDLARLPPIAELGLVPSVALLLARTQALNPQFRLTPDNAADLAAICVRLDGLPLAIELAAARLKLLAARDLLRRLDRRLPLLTSGLRDLPERQQTLHATIDWSYRLLDADERILFEQMAVFVGSWTLAEAETVCGDAGLPTFNLESNSVTSANQTANAKHHNTLDGLAALVDKSLVQTQVASDGETRFVMLETIREYALLRLRERGSYDTVAQAHADYFLSFAEQAKQQFNGPQMAMWAGRIASAHDNLRTALRWFIDHANGGEPALRLGSALYSFWHLRGYYAEGLEWLERVLAKTSTIASPLRAEMLSQAGFLATALGQTEQAIALFEACLALCEKVDALNTKTSALNGLGIIFDRAGEPRGLALLEEAALLARTLNNPLRLCAMLRAWANALVTNGQIERGVAVYEEGLLLAREHKLVRSVGLMLGGLGSALTFSGQYARALPLLEESLALQEQLDNLPQMAWSFLFLGVLCYLQDQWLQARQHFSQSLAIVAKLGNLNSLPDTLEGLAGVAAAQQSAVQAARLLGAAEALRTVLNIVRVPVARAYYERIFAATRAQLTEDALAAAWQAGHALNDKQALVEAEAFARGDTLP